MIDIINGHVGGGRGILSAGVNFAGFSVGVAPILIPHKNKARFILLTNQSVRQDAYYETPYQVLDAAFNLYSSRVESSSPLASPHQMFPYQRHQGQSTAVYFSERAGLHSASGHYVEHCRHAGPAVTHYVGHYKQTAPTLPSYGSRLCGPLASLSRESPHVYAPAPSVQHSSQMAGPVAVGSRMAGQVAVGSILPGSLVVASPARRVWSQSQQLYLYEIIETNNTTLLGGLIGFIAAGHVSLGIGLLGQGRWQVTSHRKVMSREAAYRACELDPPKSLRDVLNWDDYYTNISWLQLRGLKIVGGLYAVAHAGFVVDIEGIWEHRVRKEKKKLVSTGPEKEVITVELVLIKQGRLKGSAGVTPFLMANKDLAHAAKINAIKFRFIDIEKDPRISNVLNKLIAGHDSCAIAEAKALADTYSEAGWTEENSPIFFVRELKRDDHEARDRLRARLPLIANAQKVKKKRDREERQTILVAGEEYPLTVLVSEISIRKDFQYPIESSFRSEERRIYPERVGIDSEHHVKWPLDYRNSHFEETTQVREKKQGDIDTPYEVVCARFIWSMIDNYITQEKFLHILKRIGTQTGLGPVLFQQADIPDFKGPVQRPKDLRESMRIYLQIHLRDEDKLQVFKNILQSDFVNLTLALFDAYALHPDGDYLNISSGYSSKENYFRFMRHIVEDRARKIVNNSREIHKKMLKGKTTPFLGVLSPEIKTIDKMHMVRDLLDDLKLNPFVFLTALNRTSPKSFFEVTGTSVNIDRVIDVTLARNIMENKAQVPASYRASLREVGSVAENNPEINFEEW